MSGAYYNELDPYAAQWLRNLIQRGHIAAGDVDTRSIEDVHPDDLKPYKQCHFFAGLGAWSKALRLAGWPDDKRVWTGSAPCQPFSSAGAGNGFDDKRHLWPSFHWLIAQCQPERIYGEQVASKAVDPWLDLVQTDLEALGYAFGALAFPSAGVGAPHIRDRTYWMADACSERRIGREGFSSGRFDDRQNARRLESNDGFIGIGQAGHEWLDHTDNPRPQGHAGHDCPAGRGGQAGSVAAAGLSGRVDDTRQHDDAGESRAADFGQSQSYRPTNIAGGSGISSERLADTIGQRHDGGRADRTTRSTGSGRLAITRHAVFDADSGASPTNGHWRAADWLLCRDGKWRPVEPGTFPLAHGSAARVGRLRAYGNAINLAAAYEFIMATRDY